MISIKNLCISFGNQRVLDDVSFDLPRVGLICICGESGSGKSSLLNAISCLIPFEGSIKIDGLEIGKLNERDGASYRLRHIGFVFQDFKLFVNQTVQENVRFPLAVSSNDAKSKIIRRVNDALSFCEIKGYNKRICNTLSGGEKQRVAIARALVNNPKILLCDEPTGSLDEKTGKEIMKIIKSYSKKGLVLMVTHDKDIANEYADEIINIEDKNVVIREPSKTAFNGGSVAFLSKNKGNSSGKVPFSFSINHAKQNMKQKRIRTFLSTAFMSLGLLGIGLSIAFSNSIENDIKRSYSTLAETSTISVQKKANLKVEYQNLSLDDTKELVEKYNKKFVIDYGVAYRCNFEEFFKDSNSFYICTQTHGCLLPEFSIRHFNDFYWLEEIEQDIMPKKIETLEDDEIILGLTISQIRKICSGFGIDTNVAALSNFFENNQTNLVIELENSDWEYWDEQIFTVVGFTLSTSPYIAHSNHFFNKAMLEDNMRFPTTDEYDKNEYPWVIEKITYIKTNDTYEFIKELREQGDLDFYCFELCDTSFFVSKFSNVDITNLCIITPFYSPEDKLTKKEVSYILEADSNLENPILYNNGGYVSYPQSLISGFLKRCYFSFNEDDLFETIENNASIEINKNESEILKETVVYSDFSKSFETHIAYFPNYGGLKEGRNPNNLNEIVISSAFQNKYNLNSSDYLFIAVTTNEINKEKGINLREYKTVKLNVVGIKESDDLAIYHDPFWVDDFFALQIGLSAKETAIHSVSFSLKDDGAIEDSVSKLKRAFPQYEIINPLSGINESIDSLCSAISKFIFFVSLLSLIISLILLCSCTYLHVQDIKKEIALARCLGISKTDSLSFLTSFMVYSLGTSLTASMIELTITNLAISYLSSSILSLPFEFSISVLAYVAMIGGSLLIGLLSVGITSKHIKSITPMDCLKM